MQRRPPRVTGRSHHARHRYVGSFPWASPPAIPCPFTNAWLREASPLTPHIFRGKLAACTACRRWITKGDTFYSANPRVSYYKPFCWECGIGLNLHFHGAHIPGVPDVGPDFCEPLSATAVLPDLAQSQARALLHDAACGVGRHVRAGELCDRDRSGPSTDRQGAQDPPYPPLDMDTLGL